MRIARGIWNQRQFPGRLTGAAFFNAVWTPSAVLACGDAFEDSAHGETGMARSWSSMLTAIFRSPPGAAFLWIGLTVVTLLAVSSPYWVYHLIIRAESTSAGVTGKSASRCLNTVLLTASLALSLFLCRLAIEPTCRLLAEPLLADRLRVWGVALLCSGFCFSCRSTSVEPLVHSHAAGKRISFGIWWKQFVFLPAAWCFLGVFLVSQILLVFFEMQ